MRTDIFYFSGTGNSLKIARDLAAELGEAKVIDISRAINEEIDLSAERVGLIFPVYMWGMPLIVSRFIKKMKAPENTYIFAVANYGGMPADTLGQTARELAQQGLKLSAGFGIKMPGNYTPLYGALADEKQKMIFAKEENRIKEITQIIKEGSPRKIEKGPIWLNWIFSFLYKLGSPRIPVCDKDFWADEKCNSCGICEKVCPVNNIEISEGKPVWRHHCEQCMACLQWCPQQAIQYKKSTINRKRYTNPSVKVEDFIKAPLSVK